MLFVSSEFFRIEGVADSFTNEGHQDQRGYQSSKRGSNQPRLGEVTQTIFSFLMVIDIILTFMTAIKKEMKIEFDDDELKKQRSLARLTSFNKVSNNS